MITPRNPSRRLASVGLSVRGPLVAAMVAFLVVVCQVARSAEASGGGPEPAAVARDSSPGVPPATVAPSRQVRVPAAGERPAYWAFVPPGTSAPRTILLALHGMGQSGEAIGGQMLPFALEQNWVVVSPTLDYGEWRDPDGLARAEARLLPQILEVVDHARRELGIATRERIVVFGFSRGAHAAARLGLLFPARIVSIAAASGGVYTLPGATARNASGRLVTAPFPFGTTDFVRHFSRAVDVGAISRVQYWVGVGANDNRDADVPRTWDAFLGRNRLERGARFARAMEAAGSVTRFAVLPNMGHELAPPAIADGIGFLAGSLTFDALRANGWRWRPAPVPPPSTPRIAAPVRFVPPISFEVPLETALALSAMVPLRSSSRLPLSERPPVVVAPWARVVGRHVAQ